MVPNTHHSPDNPLAIDVSNVSFTYPDGTNAVKDVSLDVQQGEFFGFLGPNGAGKTTTIKMLVSLLTPDIGRIEVNGYDIIESPRSVRATVGYTAQDTGIDPELIARENISFACAMYHVPKQERAGRIDTMLDLVGLTEVADKKAESFSGGMKRRLDIATSLVHDPPLLFLDEPTTGLDPKSRIRLWEHFREINEQGTTMLLTTQNMQEADELCDRITIINDGELVATGTPTELKAMSGGETIQIAIGDGSPELLDDAIAVIQGEHDLPGVIEDIVTIDNRLVITSASAKTTVMDLLNLFREADLPVTGFEIAEPSLDDAFLHITGETFERQRTGDALEVEG